MDLSIVIPAYNEEDNILSLEKLRHGSDVVCGWRCRREGSTVTMSV